MEKHLEGTRSGTGNASSRETGHCCEKLSFSMVSMRTGPGGVLGYTGSCTHHDECWLDSRVGRVDLSFRAH